jgi:hypothetical protein
MAPRFLCLLPLGLVLTLLAPVNVSAQGDEKLAGTWVIDRNLSSYGPGDPGAERLIIELSANHVIVNRVFTQASKPAVWSLPLTGAPPPPRSGSARVLDGKLVITHDRREQVVIHVYTVKGDTLSVERTIHTKLGGRAPDVQHVMVYRRSA